jgi:hypothetical protein
MPMLGTHIAYKSCRQSLIIYLLIWSACALYMRTLCVIISGQFMRTHILTVVVLTGLACCVTKNKDKTETTELATQDLELNEIVHDSLTSQQIKDIERIQKVFSEVNPSSLEETIENFKRDQNPDNEIAIWLKMADAYGRFTLSKGQGIEHNKKSEAYQLILLRSMMTETEVLDKVQIKYLTEDEVKEVFSYYADLPEPLKVEKK